MDGSFLIRNTTIGTANEMHILSCDISHETLLNFMLTFHCSRSKKKAMPVYLDTFFLATFLWK